MQNVQVLLQPTEIETQPRVRASRAGSAAWRGRSRAHSRISTSARWLWRGPVEQGRQGADVVGAEDDVDPRCALDDGAAVLLRQAAADGDLHVGVAQLGRPQLAEVAVELVVGVLAHRAGVEDDDVGRLRPVRAGGC